MPLRVLNNEKPKMSELEASFGGFSNPSKMPGLSWSISAERCNVGSKLREKENSVCSDCYALKGNYIRFAPVMEAHERRYQAYIENPEAWANGIVQSLSRKQKRMSKDQWFFRFFDAGDIQSMEMLLWINQITFMLPDWKFWLPTKEYGIISKYRKMIDAGEVVHSPNLTIRISAAMIDGEVKNDYGFTSSKVTSGKHVGNKREGRCVAYKQENQCGECRSCWDSEISVVTYPLH